MRGTGDAAEDAAGDAYTTYTAYTSTRLYDTAYTRLYGGGRGGGRGAPRLGSPAPRACRSGTD